MAKIRDKNFVSIGFWLLAMIVMAIPIVNIIMTIVWAFTGENESRKNYFKAFIVVFLLLVGLTLLLLALGTLPVLLHKLGRLLK
jgi:hypothetical protein